MANTYVPQESFDDVPVQPLEELIFPDVGSLMSFSIFQSIFSHNLVDATHVGKHHWFHVEKSPVQYACRASPAKVKCQI